MGSTTNLIQLTLCGKILGQILAGTVVIIAAVNLNYFNGSYQGVVANWNQDLPFELTKGTQSPSEPTQKSLLEERSESLKFTSGSYRWNGTYEGATSGCYCSHSDSHYGVSSGLHSGYCSHNQTAAGCRDSYPIAETTMQTWDPNERLTVQTISGSSFSVLYKNMNPDGSCKPDTIRCGTKNSISQGICVPVAWGLCPISDLRIGATDAIYNMSVQFKNYQIAYATDGTGKNPIADFKIGQYVMCENPNRVGLTPGRTAYKLDRASYVGCETDNRYTVLDGRGEKTLFDLNQVDYWRAIQFYTSDQYTWNRFTRRILEWKPACLKEVPSVLSTAEHIDKANTLNIILTIVSVILNVINVGLYIAEIVSLRRGGLDEIRLKQITCVRIIFMAFLLPMLWIMYFSTKPVKVYFEFLVTQSCSDSQTNQTFDGLYHAIDSRVFLYNFISAVLGFLMLTSEMVMFFCRFYGLQEKICPEKRRDEYQGSPNLVEAEATLN